MTPPPLITDEEWNTYKPFIEREYLTNNGTAARVARALQRQYNLPISERRLKIKFDSWKWDKKIPAGHYTAMYRVTQDLGSKITFIVPKKGGREMQRVDAKKVIKETQRKKANRSNKGLSPLEEIDLQTAHETLQAVGITFEPHHAFHTQPRLAAIRTQGVASWPPPLERELQDLREQPEEYDESDDDDSDDDGSCTDSDVSMPDTDLIEPTADAETIQESSRELNLQNFPAELRPSLQQHHRSPHRIEGRDQRRMTGVLPCPTAYLVDLHCDVFPHTPEYKLAIPSVAIVRHYQGTADVMSDSGFLSNNHIDNFGLSFTPELPGPQQDFREKLIEQTLSEYYRHYDPDGHRKMALEFSAYYVVQVLAGHEMPDHYDHVDRNDARSRLRTMLDHNNMQLLTHCYWVSSIVMSHDRIRLLLAFLEDCIDCIETSTSYLGHVLRPWIRLMVLNHRKEYSHYAARSPRLSPSVLEQMNMSFDASKELRESMEYLGQHGHEESHTYLILRLYRTWDRGHQGDPDTHIQELLDCLPLIESKFGVTHLIAVNSLAMVASGYEKSGRPIFAKFYVDTALSRLKLCSKMLVSRSFQLQLRLARLHLAEGQLHEAREILEDVFSYRQQHHGVQAPQTWEAAEILFSTMGRQGFGLEAQNRRAELQARYEEEWRKHPISNYDTRERFHPTPQSPHQR